MSGKRSKRPSCASCATQTQPITEKMTAKAKTLRMEIMREILLGDFFAGIISEAGTHFDKPDCTSLHAAASNIKHQMCFTGVAYRSPLAPPPGKRAPSSTDCQNLYLCEVLRAADRKADFRTSNNSARSRSGANEEPPVSCHSMRTELPGNTTSRGRDPWADWFPLRARSGPDPRRAATAGKTPAHRGDSAPCSACASRPRVLPESSPRAKEWMASHTRPTPNPHPDGQNPRPVPGSPSP